MEPVIIRNYFDPLTLVLLRTSVGFDRFYCIYIIAWVFDTLADVSALKFNELVSDSTNLYGVSAL